MLHTRIREEIKEAMKAKDETRLLALRGLLSAFTNELVALKRKPSEELSDDEALAVIRRAVKQRKDSIEQFLAGGRKDLAENEKAEIDVLEPFLPKMASRDEIRRIVESKIAELGALDKSKMGVLMGAVMKELKNNADGKEVKEIIEKLLK